MQRRGSETSSVLEYSVGYGCSFKVAGTEYDIIVTQHNEYSLFGDLTI
jgi:hypothetical protein